MKSRGEIGIKRNIGWDSILRSHECSKVLAQVAALRKRGDHVYPSEKDVFRAFEDCPFGKVRVVILGQDPYARKGQAIGRAFAVPESTEKVPRSLKNIFEEVRRDYPRGLMPKPTLESWAKQGVFLLNTTLTVKAGHRNSHAKIIRWKEAVTAPTLENLSAEREHLVFMLWGNHAKSFEHFLDQRRHLVLKASHPSPLSEARGADHFRACGHFRKANKYLSKHGIKPIIWTHRA
jgi:uracil-DNA glycosylase